MKYRFSRDVATDTLIIDGPERELARIPGGQEIEQEHRRLVLEPKGEEKADFMIGQVLAALRDAGKIQ